MAKISKKARKIKAESSSEEEYIDSDEELQEAFARGDLKPGLIAEVPVKRKPNEYPNFVAQMKSKLEKIQFRDDWIERLDITAAPIEETEEQAENYNKLRFVFSLSELPQMQKLNRKYKQFSQKGVDLKTDDIQREMLFYKQAQTAVVVGLRRLHTLGIPTKRPEDYFAQMAKSDDQMLKVKRYALEKQLGQERSQKIAKLRDLRKYGKKVQVQVGLERSKKKREMMNKLKEFKEGKLKNLDFLDEDDRPKRGEMLDKTKEEVKKRNAKKNQFRGNSFFFALQKLEYKRVTPSTANNLLSNQVSERRASFHLFLNVTMRTFGEGI
nr:EOG090X0D84 [Artemia franciscana]